MKKLLLITVIAALSGCAMTVPQERAHHFALRHTETLNGNFVNNTNGIYRLNLPAFEKAYADGKADRSAGKPHAYAEQMALALRDRATAAMEHATYTFAPNDPGSDDKADDRDAKEYWYGLAQTYLDGYAGK